MDDMNEENYEGNVQNQSGEGIIEWVCAVEDAGSSRVVESAGDGGGGGRCGVFEAGEAADDLESLDVAEIEGGEIAPIVILGKARRQVKKPYHAISERISEAEMGEKQREIMALR